jgi:hypothetical protein
MAIMRRISSVGTISVVVLVGVLALQQGPFIVRGDYSRRVVWESTSPDNRYRVEVRRQVTFPAMIEPSGWAYFAVVDNETGREGARTVVALPEFFDFKRPKVEWTSTAVEVLNFDQRRPAAVRLLLAH